MYLCVMYEWVCVCVGVCVGYAVASVDMIMKIFILPRRLIKVAMVTAAAC